MTRSLYQFMPVGPTWWYLRPINHHAAHRAKRSVRSTVGDRSYTVDHSRGYQVLSTPDRPLSLLHRTRWQSVGFPQPILVFEKNQGIAKSEVPSDFTDGGSKNNSNTESCQTASHKMQSLLHWLTEREPNHGSWPHELLQCFDTDGWVTGRPCRLSNVE